MLSFKPACLLIETPDQADGAVSVVKFQPGLAHVLRTDQQDMIAVQLEEIRAFPHPSILVVTAVEDGPEMPVDCVLALVEKDRAALVVAAVADDAGKAAVGATTDLRVAEIVDAEALRNVFFAQNRILLVLDVVFSVAEGQTLGLIRFFDPVFPAFFLHTGVHQNLAAVIQFDRRA